MSANQDRFTPATERLRQDVDCKINDISKNNKVFEETINKKLNDIDTSLGKYGERLDSAIRISGIQLPIFTAIASIVIALVAIVLGIGVFKYYIDHNRLVDDAKKRTKEMLDKWKLEREKAMDRECDKIVKRLEGDFQNFSTYTMLRDLLTKNDLKPDEVYPLLTPLIKDPKISYKPTFNKIISLNISNEITSKAKEGLSNLTEA